MKRSLDRRAFFRGLALAAATLPLAPLAARAADRNRANDLGERLMCLCGCGQPLVHCGMINCPKATPMRLELTRRLDAGETDAQILAGFEEKYGHVVLSDGGGMKFVPYIVLGAGGVAAALIVRRWKASGKAVAADPAAAEPGAGEGLDAEYRRRVEEDLQKITPED